MHARTAFVLAIAIAGSVLSPVGAHAAAPSGTVTASSLLAQFSPTADVSTGYDRTLFEHWIDADADGCDTRQEVLIAESVTAVAIDADCGLTGGQWTSWYDASSWTQPADVDIDHFIPLSEAWRSGAYRWTADTRRAFANDLEFDPSLVAVTDNLNQSKGDRDPALWMPPLTDAATICRYATEWVEVKYRWSLAMDQAEMAALAGYLSGDCGSTVVSVPPVAPVSIVETPAPGGAIPDPQTTQLSVYRFWSPRNSTHFYTMSVAERDSIISRYPTEVWSYEGPMFQAFPVQQPGTVPLYRFYSTKLGGHFYTTNEAEKQHVIDLYDDYTWLFEGTAFYVYPTDTPRFDTSLVARFWSPTFQHHFYTASAAEASTTRGYPARIWTFEGYDYRVPSSTELSIPSTPPQYVTPPPPVVVVTPPPVVVPPASVYFQNCTAVRAAGRAPIYRGQPGYGAHLDRDGDGIGCER